MNARSQELKPWHSIDLSSVTNALASHENGLSQKEAVARLEKYERIATPTSAHSVADCAAAVSESPYRGAFPCHPVKQ